MPGSAHLRPDPPGIVVFPEYPQLARLIHRLVGFAEANDLGEVFPGPVDVLFTEGDYVEPDIGPDIGIRMALDTSRRSVTLTSEWKWTSSAPRCRLGYRWFSGAG